MIIGITGGTGCGKTTALDAIRDLGGMVLDCDAIYHELLQTDTQLLSAIESRFPGTVENGELQRKKLGSIVFGNSEALQDLNRITHAAVVKEVKRKLAGFSGLAAIDAIALFESGLNDLCAHTVAITAPIEQRIPRLMVRDGISEDYAKSRIAAQKSETYYREKCDSILVNDSDKSSFYQKCLAFFRPFAIMNP